MAQSTTDITIDCNQALSVFVNDITQALSAINSCHAGTSAPTYNVEEGVLWLDTTDGDYVLKAYINGSWVTVVDKTGDEFATVGGNVIKGRLDNNDAKHDGSTQTSPDFIEGSWKIDDTTITVTAEQFNYMNTADGDIQDAIDQEETPYTHPTSTGWRHVPSGGSENQILRYNADGAVFWDDPDPAIASSSSVGINQLKVMTVEIHWAPYINDRSSLSTSLQTRTINLTDIYAYLSLSEAAQNAYGAEYTIAPYGSYWASGGPGFFNDYVPNWFLAPEIKVSVDPNLNNIGYQTYDPYTYELIGPVLYPGDYGYISSGDIYSVSATHDVDCSTTATTYHNYIKLSTYEGCRVSVKLRFITDYGDYTY